MPTPPTITESDMGAVVGGNPYGSRLADGSTTWGKTRCVFIDGYTAWSKGDNSLVIDGGFYPSDGLHLRVWRWPVTFPWVDSNSDPHTEYGGPILGFIDNSGSAGGVTYISVGAYDWNGNDTDNPFYTSANNQLDENDAAACYTGRLVNGTYTTTADWSDASPTPTWFGQNIGGVSFTGYTSISGFTAF